MSKTNITPWDSADYLDTPERIEAYLEAVLEENDPALFVAALGSISRAKGMGSIAQHSGLKREGLYRSLAKDSNPNFSTVFKVIDALGLQMKVERKVPAEHG